MWSGRVKAWLAALDDLLKEMIGDWLFVPGHGPVTDAEDVRNVWRYMEYVDSGVTQDREKDGLPLQLSEHDEAYAERVLYSAIPDARTGHRARAAFGQHSGSLPQHIGKPPG